MRFIYYWAYKLAKIYWFVFRPQTRGVKCVLRYQDKVLLIKNSYGQPAWTFPGGGIKPGESPAAAAKREVREEVGITIATPEQIGEIYSTAEYKRDTVTVFVSQVESLDFQIDNTEVAEAAWFDATHMPQLSMVGQRVWEIYQNRITNIPTSYNV